MPIECFEIEWTKPFPYIEAEGCTEAEKGGVYAKVIGKTKRIHYIGESQELGRRTGDHRRNDGRAGTPAKNRYISFGIIYTFKGREKVRGCTPKQLAYIESYLVNAVKPKGNGDSTKRGYKGKPLIVINTGKITRPTQRIMTSNPELSKLIATKAKKKPSSVWP